MTQTPSNTDSTGSLYAGFTLLLASAVLPVLLLYMALNPPGGNDMGGHGMRMALVGVAFILVSPATAAFGLFFVHANIQRGSMSIRSVAWLAAMPTIALSLFLVAGFALQMRPVPVYNPTNYQHLIGQNLRDAKAELGTWGAVSGSEGGDGASYRFLSFRGMRIIATQDGTITEVKDGYRK